MSARKPTNNPREKSFADAREHAFKVAQCLAATAMEQMLLGGGHRTEEHHDAQADVLRAYTTRVPQNKKEATRDQIYRFVESHEGQDACRVSDGLGTLESDNMMAGYLFGLAMGLALSKGGAR